MIKNDVIFLWFQDIHKVYLICSYQQVLVFFFSGVTEKETDSNITNPI